MDYYNTIERFSWGKGFLSCSSLLIPMQSSATLQLYPCVEATSVALGNVNFSSCIPPSVTIGAWTSIFTSRKWGLHSTAQTENVVLRNEDKTTWDACKEVLSTLNVEDEEKILGKAFGQIHSAYWGEERKKVMPKFEVVNDILNYLRSLSLSDDDLFKLLKKFPEVLGCNLEEVKTNVKVLEKEWGIKGKSLRNLLLRNPKVLGYNIDCKGDCMAQCTRCWARF